MPTRRDLLKAAASMTLASPFVAPLFAAARGDVPPNPYGKRGLGAAPTGFSARMRANAAATPPVDWVDYCHGLGLSGVEAQTPPTDPAAISALRKKLEAYNMRITFEFPLPRTDADLAHLETVAKAASEVGAFALHAGLTQRRYEQFTNFADFKQSFETMKTQVAKAEPILRKYKIPAALENHKGWRAAEHAAWFKSLGSEYVQVHFDFGNNVSLCEDPMETLDILLPYTMSCHIKDMAVAPYEDGFLLSEVALGDGFLDLKGMVQKLRAKDPNMPFDLEMISRDPLKIPIYTDKYWVTFDDSYSPLPGRDVARILKIMKDHPPKKPLPMTTGLTPEARVKQEDENNLASIQWARQNLEM